MKKFQNFLSESNSSKISNEDARAVYEKFSSDIASVHRNRTTFFHTGKCDYDFTFVDKNGGGMRASDLHKLLKQRGFSETSAHRPSLRSYKKNDYAIIYFENHGGGVNYMEFAPMSAYKGLIGE